VRGIILFEGTLTLFSKPNSLSNSFKGYGIMDKDSLETKSLILFLFNSNMGDHIDSYGNNMTYCMFSVQGFICSSFLFQGVFYFLFLFQVLLRTPIIRRSTQAYVPE
jgi:hypothetical protein